MVCETERSLKVDGRWKLTVGEIWRSVKRDCRLNWTVVSITRSLKPDGGLNRKVYEIRRSSKVDGPNSKLKRMKIIIWIFERWDFWNSIEIFITTNKLPIKKFGIETFSIFCSCLIFFQKTSLLMIREISFHWKHFSLINLNSFHEISWKSNLCINDIMIKADVKANHCHNRQHK